MTAKIDSLGEDPTGATNVAAGMTTAETLMGSGYNYTGENTTRQKVVIVFTDGVPTTSTAFNTSVATNAIASAKNLKDDGATVYTIGIFNGVNPEQLYGSSNGNIGSSWEVSSFLGLGDMDSADIAAGNRFLNYLSSNFKTTDEVGLNRSTSGIIIQKIKYTITKNFERDSSSYYLTATDSSSLDNIFQTISENIQSGTATVQLGASTVVQDVVTEYFNVPANGSDITVSTANYNADGTWSAAVPSGLVPTIEGDTVYVTGFDFAKNYCDTTYGRDENDAAASGDFYGRKLIIEFVVTPKAEFLGGNNVPTNGNASGIYTPNSEGTLEIVENFTRPSVNVPIPEIAVDVVDKNVYYSNSLSVSEMTNGMSATANGNNLLETLTWQDDFVNISTTDPSALADLKADTTYSVTVTINPVDTENVEGNTMDVVTGKSGYDTANVYVFKPEVTFKDTTIYKGNTPTGLADTSYVDTVEWKHGDTVAPQSMGTAPELTYSYSNDKTNYDECTTLTPTVYVGTDKVVCEGAAKDKVTVHVLKPSVEVTLADTTCYYGANYNAAGGSSVVSWAEDATTGHTDIPEVEGTAPFATATLQYYKEDNSPFGTIVMPNEDVNVYVKAFNGTTELPATFTTTCDVDDCADHNNGYFTVHPLTCSLIIKKSGWNNIDPNESFIFTVNGNNATYPIENLKVIVHGNGTVQVNGLPVGTYTATEDENWSWRYDFTSANSVKLTDNTVETITATNNRVYDLWLDFAAWCKNVFVVNNDNVTITTKHDEH